MRIHPTCGTNACLLVAVIALFAAMPAGAEEPVNKLPGARPTIDAAQFASLQAALDAVPEGGALVQLPAGTFEIDQPLRLHTEDTALVGAGTATHIKNNNKAGQPAVLVAHPECKNAKTDRRHSLWRVRVANLRVTGNPQSGAGIEARQINEIYLDGLSVSYNGGDGIFLNYCYEDPRIADCLITYNKQTGVHLAGCHDIVVSACQFEENHDALRCLGGFNLCLTGSCVDDHLGAGVVIENTYGSVVSGNMIEECRGAAIVLDRDCYGIALSANVIAHNGAGIDLRDAHGCTVSANAFTILKTDAVRIGPDSGRITVTGNNFSNSFIGAGKIRRGQNDRAAAGLVLEQTNDVAISGNIFSGLTDKAVTLRGESQGIVFANNVLTEVKSDHARLAADGVANNVERPPAQSK